MRGNFLVVVMCCIGPIYAQPPARKSPDPANPYYDLSGDETFPAFTAKLEVALNQKFDWKYADTPLKYAAAEWSERLGLPVELGERELEEVGVSGETPITFARQTLSAKSALTHILTMHGLTWEPNRGRLLITNPDAAKDLARLYPVADLAPKFPSRSYRPTRDLDTFVSFLLSVVSPSAWREGSGPPPIETVGEHSLLFRQQYQTHREVERLFASLRHARKLLADQPGEFPAAGIAVFGGEAIRKKMNVMASMQFSGTVGEFAEALHKRLHVPVLVNLRDLDEVGVGSAAKIEGEFRDLPLRVGIRKLLESQGLTYGITDETVYLSTPDAVSKPKNLAGTLFFVGMSDSEEMISAIVQAANPTVWADVGGPCSIDSVPGSPLLYVRAPEEVLEQVTAAIIAIRKAADWERTLPDAEPEFASRLFKIILHRRDAKGNDEAVEPNAAEVTQLIALIRRQVAPQSWTAKEVEIDAWRNRLLIRQRPTVLKEIETLLRDLEVIERAGSVF